MKITKIPLIEAEGSNYDIGFIVGNRLKFKLRKIIEIEKEIRSFCEDNKIKYRIYFHHKAKVNK